MPTKKAPAKNAEPAHPDGIETCGLHGVGRFAGSAERKAERGAAEEPHDRPRQNIGDVHERIVLKEHLTDHGNVGKQRNVEGLEAHGLFADEGRAEVVGKAHAEDGERKTGHGLIALKDQADHAVNQTEAACADARGQRGQPRIARFELHDEGEERAHDHHAFHAEVEHARAFGDEFAHGGVQKRRAGEHRGGQQRDEDIPGHAAPP